MPQMDVIDYQIHGDDLQFVELQMDPGEAVVGEAGSMMYMQDGIEMDTIFGDGSNQNKGILGSLFGAGKRVLTGESIFMTVFHNQVNVKRVIAFGAPIPGKIVPMPLAELGGEIIAQKDAFLAAAKGVEIDIAFQKKIGVGLFGGEGFIMQRLRGDGMTFVNACGSLIERDLRPNESLRVDTGCLVALQPSVTYDIKYVGKIKTAMFGGEGLFLTHLTGPGRIWLQSMPFSRLARRIFSAAPQTGGRRRGEGSILGALGDLLDGDGK
jgi:uncharacterized protein (TIGR00266 family)